MPEQSGISQSNTKAKNMTLRLITAPAALAVSLIEARAHLRLIGTDDDALVTAMIGAATESAEHATGRALMVQTWEAGFDAFPAWVGVSTAIELTRVPVQSVTSVTYIDSAGAVQTLLPTLYTLVQDDFGFTRILPTYGTSWPAVRGDTDGVKVRYVAGYASAALVPAAVKSWILLAVGTLYESRESETVGNGSSISLGFADALLHRYKVYA